MIILESVMQAKCLLQETLLVGMVYAARRSVVLRRFAKNILSVRMVGNRRVLAPFALHRNATALHAALRKHAVMTSTIIVMMVKMMFQRLPSAGRRSAPRKGAARRRYVRNLSMVAHMVGYRGGKEPIVILMDVIETHAALSSHVALITSMVAMQVSSPAMRTLSALRVYVQRTCAASRKSAQSHLQDVLMASISTAKKHCVKQRVAIARPAVLS
jgi:hypothetical protein